MIFEPFLNPQWEHNCINEFGYWPVCNNISLGGWSNVVGESQTADPFYDGSTDCGLLTPANIQFVLDCSINVIELDQVRSHCLSRAVPSDI